MNDVPRPGFSAHGTQLVLLTSDYERSLLVAAFDQLIAVLTPQERSSADPLEAAVGIDNTATRPDDPVLLRLLPDGYASDPDASSEFRRFTERGLRAEKSAHARTAVATIRSAGDQVTMSVTAGQSWLIALNDVRLALGTRLEVTEETYEQLPDWDPTDPRYAPYMFFDWLTWLQSTLLAALTRLDPGE